MNYITSITSRGQITIPAHVRKIINLAAGEQVVISHTNTSLTIQALPKKDDVMALFGSVHPIEKSSSPEEASLEARKIKAAKTNSQAYE